jgi:hypothetical protein
VLITCHEHVINGESQSIDDPSHSSSQSGSVTTSLDQQERRARIRRMELENQRLELENQRLELELRRDRMALGLE